jgi:DNA modification methylase
LDVLRRHVADESVDIVYADPPFKSDQNYNVLFKERDGQRAASQIRAFEDTWTWDQEDEAVYSELVTQGGRVADALEAFRKFVGPCDMLSYLVMMAPRLIECRRVMKKTGSMYLHCDQTMSHYLKVLMDAIFGPANYRNEIDWIRTNAHNFKSRYYPRVCDILLFYTKSDTYTWHDQFQPYSPEQLKRYKVEESTGRQYTGQDLTLMGTSPARQFEWRGSRPPSNRAWGYSQEKLEELWLQGRILKKQNGAPRLDGLKVYLDEMPGKTVTAVWDDVARIGNTSGERLGYPTQKPEALLERIVQASSNEGDTVLDPFCGCGTAVVVAQKFKRQWIGIDITHLAITLMKQRLKDTFGDSVAFKVVGEPVSVPDAAALAASDPYQFQWWSLGLVGARPVEGKKGADKGIDGKIVFQGEGVGKFESVIISVKAGGVTVSQLRDLCHVVDREKACIGVFISMQETTEPMRMEAVTAGFYESQAWGKKYPKIQLFTVAELLAGKQIDMPPIRQVNATFKKAPKAEAVQGEEQRLGL